MSWSLTSFWLTQEMRQVGCSRLYWIWDGFSSEYCTASKHNQEKSLSSAGQVHCGGFFSRLQPVAWKRSWVHVWILGETHSCMEAPYIMCHSEAISMKWEWVIKYSVWYLLTLHLRWRKPRELEFQVSFQKKKIFFNKKWMYFYTKN